MSWFCQWEIRSRETVKAYLVEKAVAVRVAKFASLISAVRLDRDVNSTDRCYYGSCNERLCKEHHVDDCENRWSQSEDRMTLRESSFCSSAILPCHFIRNLAK
jgi:hypothetical protein